MSRTAKEIFNDLHMAVGYGGGEELIREIIRLEESIEDLEILLVNARVDAEYWYN